MLTSYPLRGGSGRIPCFGLGTFRSSGTECYDACITALRAGYRLLDTAALYDNEELVGNAIHDFLASEPSVKREDIFVVTKLHWDHHGRENVAAQVDKSLAKLRLDYVDLYLMHSPKGGRVAETYEAILQQKALGKCRAVGVSNFSELHIRELLALNLEVPAVNQIELHLWNHQREVVHCCKSLGIVVMAFCPLARGDKFGKTGLVGVAERLGTSEAALCNYWVVKNGMVTIPKSTTAARVVDNLQQVLSLRLSSSESAELEQFDEKFECSLAVQSQRLPWEQVK